VTECSVTPGLCTQESACAVRTNWQRINQAVLGVLRDITLDQMIVPAPQQAGISAITLTRKPKTTRAAAKSTAKRTEEQAS
jgi:DNA-binding IscR family transcriptional regulator